MSADDASDMSLFLVSLAQETLRRMKTRQVKQFFVASVLDKDGPPELRDLALNELKRRGAVSKKATDENPKEGNDG